MQDLLIMTCVRFPSLPRQTSAEKFWDLSAWINRLSRTGIRTLNLKSIQSQSQSYVLVLIHIFSVFIGPIIPSRPFKVLTGKASGGFLSVIQFTNLSTPSLHFVRVPAAEKSRWRLLLLFRKDQSWVCHSSYRPASLRLWSCDVLNPPTDVQNNGYVSSQMLHSARHPTIAKPI
jgi:hypothetical protein